MDLRFYILILSVLKIKTAIKATFFKQLRLKDKHMV